jgi:DNA-binding GntR family transcriptional regulator
MLTGIRPPECRPFEGGASVIAATLEEDIVLGLLAPKVRLVEDELIGRFGAKRHHVREALVLLEALGLVERKRNIGAQVKAFSREEVIQLYEMRELLEVEAMRKIPLPVPTQPLHVLMQIQHAHDRAVQQRDARSIFRTNQEFHRHLWPRLSRTLRVKRTPFVLAR